MTLTYSFEQANVGKSTAGTNVVDARIAELVRDERVVWLVRFVSNDPAFDGVMRMTWQFEPAPGGTRVTITAEDVPPGVGEADHLAGLRSSLKNLAGYLEDHRTR